MRVLIVFAHPNPTSLNATLRDHARSVLQREGHDVQVSDLYAMKWKAVADADDRAIDLRVSRLRQKLGDDAKAPVLIRTVRSLGYMLAGPVTWRA